MSTQTTDTLKRDPLNDITIRYHSAMPNWCKLIGLDIKAVPECEGGVFMVRRDQAENIIALLHQQKASKDEC